MKLVNIGEVLLSNTTTARYTVLEYLGGGGFGEAYRAKRVQRGHSRHEVCVKVTTDQESWIREIYFGDLLRGQSGAVEIFDAFPISRPARRRQPIAYCIVSQLAEHGSLAEFVHVGGCADWTEARVLREFANLLSVLGELHAVHVTHRDLTPMNIFVGEDQHLMLGDFGIAAQNKPGQARTVDAFNPDFVPNAFKGVPADDVYQMGQILATLLSGALDKPTKRQVRQFICAESTKDLVLRAMGPKAKRFPDAYAMLRAVKGLEDTPRTTPRSLRGKRLAFSGRLSVPRKEAEKRARSAGAISVNGTVTLLTDLLVLGEPSPLWGGGTKGRKLARAEKFGTPIIRGPEFMKLTRRRPRNARRASGAVRKSRS